MEKVVLITGAARGLGRALAARFLAEKWRVIAADIDELSMAGLMEDPLASIVKMDVASDKSVLDAYTQLRDDGVVIDLIINNAGIDRYFPVSEAPTDWFRQVFEVNVFGGYRVNQVFLPLIKKPGGRIIHISSESLNLTLPFMPYPLTKKLVEGYAKTLRMELRFAGIDVIIVRPGAIKTRLLEMVSTINTDQEKWNLKKQFQTFAATASSEIGKTITPEHAANFIFEVSRIHHPAAVYKINNMLQLRIAALLPFRLVENIIYRKLL